jgi:hypothetical protein
MAEVERDWFQTRFAGAQVGYLYCTTENMTAEFDVGTAEAESDLSAYTCEVEAARCATRGRSLDEAFTDPQRHTQMGAARLEGLADLQS